MVERWVDRWPDSTTLWKTSLRNSPLLALALVAGLLRLIWQWSRHIQRRERPSPLVAHFADCTISRLTIPADQTSIAAVLLIPPGDPQAAVCIAHGAKSDMRHVNLDLLDTFIRRQMAVLLIDLDQAEEDTPLQDVGEVIQTITSSLRWLRARYAQVGVLGVSLGGCAATRAVAEGASADALAVLASPPQLRLSLDRAALEILRLFKPAVLCRLCEHDCYHLRRIWSNRPESGAADAIGDLIESLDLIGSLQHIAGQHAEQPPMLLVYAQRDAVVPQYLVDRVLDAAPAWADTSLLPPVSHLSLSMNRQVLEQIGSWMAEHLHEAACSSLSVSTNDHARQMTEALFESP